MAKGVSKDGSRTAKMKSLAGATHVFIEEADEVKEQDFDQLDLSLRTIKANKVQIIRVFNPPAKNHWIWRDYNLVDSDVKGYYMPVVKSGSDILSIWSDYHSNMHNLQDSTVKKFESFLESNPEYYYNQVRGLVPEGMKGRVYSGWQPITDEEFESIDVRPVYCIDFGYSNDPTVIVKLKYYNDRLHVREMLYKAEVGDFELCSRMKVLGITDDDLIIADSGGGGDLRIANIRRMYDINHDFVFCIRAAIKGPGSILAGISRIKERKVFVTENSHNIWKEYREYKWALDADGNPTDKPEDKYNHAMDAIRYGELAKGVLF